MMTREAMKAIAAARDAVEDLYYAATEYDDATAGELARAFRHLRLAADAAAKAYDTGGTT